MKKRLFGILLTIIVMLGILFGMQASAFAAMSNSEAALAIAPKWMKYVDGNLAVSQINIPGTHDAGTKECAMGQCQDTTIEWQLNHGVRFLDIRILIGDNDLRVYHGSFSGKLDFKDVMSTVKNFLKENPSECVIMSIKNEGEREQNGKVFETELENNYINNSAWKDLFYTAASIPKLDDVRGKIVLVRRYGNSSLGLNASAGWTDNSKDFTINRGNYKIRVQDYYAPEDVSITDVITNSKANSYSNNEKIPAVEAFDNKAKSAGSSRDTLWINFTSGNIMGTHTDTIAEKLNAYIKNRLSGDYLNGTFHGIVAMDWVTDSESQAVFMSNKISREVTFEIRVNDTDGKQLKGNPAIQLYSSDLGKTYSVTNKGNGKYSATLDPRESSVILKIGGKDIATLNVDTAYDTLTKAYVYQVTYSSPNGDISSVPIDNTVYKRGETVTVKNTSYSDQNGKKFRGWTLTNFSPVTSFTIERGEYVLTDWWTYISSSDSEIKDGATLGSKVYTVSSNTTVQNLRVSGNAVINVLPGVTLECIGSPGSGMTGGKAGIHVPQGSTVTFVGGGKVIARGGAAGNGSDGTDGTDGSASSNGFGGGNGGNGGNGGGGAGAGIGTDGGSGGKGGSGGNGAEFGQCKYGDQYDKSGTSGSNGSNGSAAAAAGTVYNDGVTLDVQGGAMGNPGDGGYSGDSAKYSKSKKYYTGAGGGGGGGGAAGSAAADIGTGGTGGGGAGGGGGGGLFTSENGYHYPGGGGGSAGIGKDGNEYGADRGSVGVGVVYDSYTAMTTTRGEGGKGGKGGSVKSGSAKSGSPYIQYTVTFDSSKNSTTQAYSKGTATKTVRYCAAYENISIPKVIGYVFDGYWTARNTSNDNGETYYVGTGRMVYDRSGKSTFKHDTLANLTLYASWTPAKYNIAYNANGGSGSMTSDVERVYGAEYRLKGNLFSREGYTFKGWNTSASSTTIKYSDESKVKNLTSTDGDTVTLYAVWERNPEPTDIEKTAAKKEVSDYRAASLYREEQQKELEAAISVAHKAIDNSATHDEMNKAVSNAKEAIDQIKTDAQLKAEEAASLALIKESAKAELDSYKKMSDYRAAQQTELSDLISSGKTAIDAAVDTAGVNSALAEAKANMDKVKTNAQLTEEERAAAEAAKKALESAKSSAKSALNSYKDFNDYNYSERTELQGIISEGTRNIDAATSISDVNSALAAAKAAMDGVKTSSEIEAESLAQAKLSAVQYLSNYGDMANYRYNERKQLKYYRNCGITIIESADSIEEIDAACAEAEANIKKLPTHTQLAAAELVAARKRHAQS